MEDKIVELTNELVKSFRYWPADAVLHWKRKALKELSKEFEKANLSDSQIKVRIVTLRLMDIAKIINPPREFWEEVAADIIGLSPVPPTEEDLSKLQKAIESYNEKSERSIEAGKPEDYMKEVAINYHQMMSEAPEREPMIRAHWLVMTTANRVIHDGLKLAEFENKLEFIPRERHLKLFAPQSIIDAMREQSDRMYHQLARIANSKTYIVNTPDDAVMKEDALKYFQNEYLRKAAATEMKEPDLGDYTDDRFKG